jgi:hypothetical protein
MIVQHSGRLLVRIARPYFNSLHAGNFSSQGLAGLRIRPLFRSSHSAGLAFALSTSVKPDWLVVTPAERSAKHPWDVAHDYVRGRATGSAAFALMADTYIEPDLLHPGPLMPATAASTGLDDNYPPQPGTLFSPAWHLGSAFTDFKDAWNSTTGQGIKIAHPDTGYWPEHASTPRNVRPEQGYNYYECNTNTVDPGTGGIGNMPGHGTATIALLAGSTMDLNFNGQSYLGDIGGAPDADVVPIRIGPSVVHLYTRVWRKVSIML